MPVQIRNQINGSAFFDDDEFRAYDLAQQIVDLYPIATTIESDTLYMQQGAVWDEYGEQTLRGELWAILGNAANQTRINEVVDAVKHLSRTPREGLLGLPPHKVIVQDGIVDLLADTPDDEYELERNGPGTFTRVPVKYDANDVHPERFNDFLFDVLHPDDVSIMWELIGYCLYRDYPIQKAFMFIGEGANGKSTLLAALREFLGEENVTATELSSLAENRFAPAQLEGQLANIAPDISSEDIEQTGTFKALTGGDRISAERKYQDPFHFKNYAKLIFSANTVPQAADETYAYERRWLYFDFPNRFEGDEATPQYELLAMFEEEQPAILNQAIEAFRHLWERGEFEDTVYMREHEEAHDRAMDPAYEFVNDEMIAEEDAIVRITDAYEAFRTWCAENDRPTQGQDRFKKHVQQLYAPAKGKDPADKRYDVWDGVRLADDGTADSSGWYDVR